MNRIRPARQVLNFLFYTSAQLLVVNTISITSKAFCFIYVGFLLMLPLSKRHLATLLLMSFFTGLLIDMFYGSFGIHSFASVLLVYIRTWVSGLLLPARRAIEVPTLHQMGLMWFSTFILPLIFIHHLTVFTLDAWSKSLFLWIGEKAFFSMLCTYICLVVTQAVFHR